MWLTLDTGYDILVAEDAKCLYIEDEEAVRDIDKAIELSLKWLNDKTDVSVELYDLLDGEDKGFAVYQQKKR